MKIREIIKLDVDNMNCIVISHPEFKQLAKDTGIPIYELDYLVSKWQDKNNIFGRFPSKDELKEGINFSFKTTKIVSNNLDRIESLWKQLKDTDVFWNKIQKDFGIPKEQLVLFRESEGNTIKDKLIDFISKYSYNIQVKTATQESDKRGVYAHPHFTLENGDEYVKYGENDYEFYPKGDRTNSKVISKETYEAAKPKVETFTSHYSHMTVPGGTNYTENEIITPEVTPSIKGHAQFASDNGIGWFRSDDEAKNAEIFEQETDNDDLRYRSLVNRTRGGIPTKTRRILEVQSDLFQKGRNANTLVQEKQVGRTGVIDENADKFLHLLNKDNNWVTFFVKSIIQDSAKKGYEKVLFPTGNTASKVEGHTTLEEFKKQKEARLEKVNNKLQYLKNLKVVPRYEKVEKRITKGKHQLFNGYEKKLTGYEIKDEEGFSPEAKYGEINKVFITKEEGESTLDYIVEHVEDEINQLKQELERVSGPEGLGALKPIYNFYETVVKNILKKNYQVNSITDEYGNTWNEINLHEASDTILAALGEKGITKQEFDSLTAEEKRHLIHQLFNC